MNTNNQTEPLEVKNDDFTTLAPAVTNIEFVNFMLNEAVKLDFSEIFLDSKADFGRLRVRRSGTVYTRFSNIPLQRYNMICNVLCVLANKEVSFMQRHNLESRITLDNEKKSVFGFFSMPRSTNPSVTLRSNWGVNPGIL